MTKTVARAAHKPAVIVLEDGAAFEGVAVGAEGRAVGEIVFNTSMSGYQEILTDPSYAGQIVTLTVPHVGNYGVNPADLESQDIKVAGFVVRDISERPSNWRATMSLPDWLREKGVVAIYDVDTRALTRHIRSKGVMKAVIAHNAGPEDAEALLAYLREQPDYGEEDFVARVRCDRPMTVHVEERADGLDVELRDFERPPHGPHVVVLDFGVKHSIVRHLHRRGLHVTLVPSAVDADTVRRLEPDGILVSNGPGDPALLDDILRTLSEVAETLPTFGICLGHQVLARAFGATTFKLPFGHRGPNQPVQDLETGKVQMTSQNHGYAVEAESMPDELEITHINLNDATVEGFRHRTKPVFAVQYHPEAGPGPHDAENFFDRFAEVVKRRAE